MAWKKASITAKKKNGEVTRWQVRYVPKLKRYAVTVKSFDPDCKDVAEEFRSQWEQFINGVGDDPRDRYAKADIARAARTTLTKVGDAIDEHVGIADMKPQTRRESKRRMMVFFNEAGIDLAKTISSEYSLSRRLTTSGAI